MKAMILAAGDGTRLQPLTLNKPKALVEVGGKPLLEWVILKLIKSGFDSIIINVHHFPEMIEAFIKQKNNFNIQIELSWENEILGTGGGIKKTAYFLKNSPSFLVHNVDVLSTINLTELIQIHQEHQNLATLFTQFRPTKRYLVFDDQNLLQERQAEGEDVYTGVKNGRKLLAFNGIQVISSRIFEMMDEQGCFSTIDCYLKWANAGERIEGVDKSEVYWRDLGRVSTLEMVDGELKSRKISGEILIN
ncbi:NTP transferase domain-containing protein [candidate division KSB1 bacterium]|nr:NTP transferase domain-containing protein [candidate division KSB1 bacterium]